MNLLFINPYIYDFTAYDLWLRPLGLMYLASVVKRHTDCRIFWIDTLDRFQDNDLNQTGNGSETPNFHHRSKQDGRGKFHREIVEKPEIYQSVPRYYSRFGMPAEQFKNKLSDLPEMDLIFMTSLMTYWIDGVRFTLRCLRERFPRTEVILGGVLPTLFPGNLRDHVPVDHIIAGPGENQILDFLTKRHVRVLPHSDFSDIDQIPTPDNELLSNRKIIPLLTARGCPYACTYCASKLLNPVFRERSPDRIREEIKAMSDRYHPEHIVIFDDALLVNQDQRFHRIFNGIGSLTGARFHTPNGLHVREIRPDTAERLFQSGFKTVRLGFESLKAEILASSTRKVTRREMTQAIINLEKAGYRRGEIEVYILFGLVGQNKQDLEKILFFTEDLGVIPRLSYFSPVPGTLEYQQLQRKGVLTEPVNMLETNKTYFVYQKSGMSREDIQAVKELTHRIASRNKCR